VRIEISTWAHAEHLVLLVRILYKNSPFKCGTRMCHQIVHETVRTPSSHSCHARTISTPWSLISTNSGPPASWWAELILILEPALEVAWSEDLV
jgi:hypothetical protein